MELRDKLLDVFAGLKKGDWSFTATSRMFMFRYLGYDVVRVKDGEVQLLVNLHDVVQVQDLCECTDNIEAPYEVRRVYTMIVEAYYNEETA